MSSSPDGAEARFDIVGEAPKTCVTPCVMEVKRQDEVTVTVSKPGFETEIIPLQKEIATGGAAGFAGNILLGGVVGMAVDGASGAALDHKPNPVITTLRPNRPPAPPPPHQRRRAKPTS